MGWSIDNSISAEAAAAEALKQALRAETGADSVNEAIAESEQVTLDNKIIPLTTVATIALRNSTYPNPQHGSVVIVSQGVNPLDAETYRFVTGTGWVLIERTNATTTGNITAQLADMTNDFDEAVAGVTVDSEVILARGGETTLGNRLGKLPAKGKKVTLSEERFELRQALGAMNRFISLPDKSFICQQTGGIRKYNADLTQAWLNTSYQANGNMHYDSLGNIYVPTISGIVKLDSNGIYQTTFKSGLDCRTVQIDSTGNIYVGGLNYFGKLASGGTLLWEKTDLGVITEVKLMPNGNIATIRYTTSNGIMIFNPAGTQLFISNLGYPTTIVVNKRNEIYVMSIYNLKKLTDQLVEMWSTVNISSSSGVYQMSLDNSGNLYVPYFNTSESSRFYKIAPDGYVLNEIFLGFRAAEILFIDRSKILFFRSTTGGGTNQSGVLSLRQDILEVN